MSTKKKILLTFGTRPEAIKMAPLFHELKKSENFIVETCVTAQHRSMLDNVLEIFEITPNYDLDLMKNDQKLVTLTSKILENISRVYKESSPDIVLVHGDTTTAMAAALSAFYENIIVGHVEAGLRTYDIQSPYPEELNRQVISRISDFHFAPTEICRNNLNNENLNKSIIEVTGNTVIDALFWTLEKINSDDDLCKLINKKLVDSLNFDVQRKQYVLITGHRRENFGDSFVSICESIKELAKRYSDINFVYPVHLNPNVQKPVHDILDDLENVYLIEPLNYVEFIYLMNNCYFILTDSGGIQEEAPSLKKPVLVMRDTTERPEAVESGAVKLVGSSKEKIIEESAKLIDCSNDYMKMCVDINPYGNGNASFNIKKALEREL